MFHISQPSSGFKFAVCLSPESSCESPIGYPSSSSREPSTSGQESPPLSSMDDSHFGQQDGKLLDHVSVSTFQQSDGPCISHARGSFSSSQTSDSFSSGTTSHLEDGSILSEIVDGGPPRKSRRCKQPNPRKRTPRNTSTGTFTLIDPSDPNSPDLEEHGPPKKAKMGRRCKQPATHKMSTRSTGHSSSSDAETYAQDGSFLNVGKCGRPLKKTHLESRRNRAVTSRHKSVEVNPSGNRKKQPKLQESPLLYSNGDSHFEQRYGESFEYAGVSTSPQSDVPSANGSSSSNSTTSVYFVNGDFEGCCPTGKKAETESGRKQTTPSCKRTVWVSRTGRRNHPQEATNVLKTWVAENIEKPYPTEEQKNDLAEESGLTLLQVTNWFINERRRNLEKRYGGDLAMCKANRKALNRNGRQNLNNKENQNPGHASGSRLIRLPSMEVDPRIASRSRLNRGPLIENSSGSQPQFNRRALKRKRNSEENIENQDPNLVSCSGSSLEEEDTRNEENQGSTIVSGSEYNPDPLKLMTDSIGFYGFITILDAEWDNLPSKPEMPKIEWIKKRINMEHCAQ